MFTCSHVRAVAEKDQISRPGDLLETAEHRVMLIMVFKLLLFVMASFILVAGHLDYLLPLDTCSSKFLQFLCVCFQRRVLNNYPLHYIVNAVYTEPLFLVPNIC